MLYPLKQYFSVAKEADWSERLDYLSKIFAVLTVMLVPVSVAATNIFIVLTVIFSIAAGNLSEKIDLAWANPFIKWMSIFLAFTLFSLIYTRADFSSAIHSLHKYGKLIFIVFLMPLFTEKRWRQTAINGFIVVMLLTLLLSYLKKFGVIHIGHAEWNDDVFKSHIETGFFLAFTAFLIARNALTQPAWRWLKAATVLLILCQLFFINGGRTGYVAIVALALLWVWQLWHWKGFCITAAVIPLILVAIYASSPVFNQKLGLVKSDLHRYKSHSLQDNSIGLRITFAKNSFAAIKQHLLFGLGVGSFRRYYRQHYGSPPGFRHGLGDPHNQYVLILFEFGAIGLLLFLAMFYKLWELSRFLPKDESYLCQGLVVAFIVGSACDSFLFLTTTGYFFVGLSAVLLAGFHASDKSQQTPSGVNSW